MEGTRTTETATQEQDFGKSFVWEKCPDSVDEEKKYLVDESNPRVATNAGVSCTVTGNTPLPLDRATYWSIRVLSSKNNDGDGIYVGVAPSDVDRNGKANYNSSGWYLCCRSSTLYSGYPCITLNKKYGPKGTEGLCVRAGDTVGVIFDPVRSEITFIVNGANLGVAYTDLTFYRPLVPCVVLENKDDSVEIERPEFAVNESIQAPSGLISYSEMESVKLSWLKDKKASFYQVEMDGGEVLDVSPKEELVKKGLFPKTKHEFRVRAVVKNEVSAWSEPKKAKTLSADSFKDTEWETVPSYVARKNYYAVEKKVVATKPSSDDCLFVHCTVKGSAPIPLGTVASWRITVLASKNNDGNSIHVGVAPFDINQNVDSNLFRCGWYYDCGFSTLISGPPHNYRNEEYGIRLEGGYVQKNTAVGVTMDTTKGELSFALGNLSLGLAYEGIPLDKPLVPCVLLYNSGDSVEFLYAMGVKGGGEDTELQAPANVKAVSETCSTITFTWDIAKGARSYQVEVDGRRCLTGTTTNKYVLKRLEPTTEHEVRVRSCSRSGVSEWSAPVKAFTQKQLFENCGWKGYPALGDYEWKFTVDNGNPRVALKTYSERGSCSIVGDAPVPLGKVSSWGVRVLRSYWNNGDEIYVGVAPSDIDPNADNYDRCGWYFYCFTSTLWSGPPQNARGKEYGPKRKDRGQYVHTGSTVGVLMDTTKGELSFALDGKFLGLAFEGIPLDKPLVPCAILKSLYDMVELSVNDGKGNGGKKAKSGKGEKGCIIS